MRQKIICSAFLRALKDPFPPARQAGILAMAATQNYYSLSEVATRLLPALSVMTMDPDKGVREQVSWLTSHPFMGDKTFNWIQTLFMIPCLLEQTTPNTQLLKWHCLTCKGEITSRHGLVIITYSYNHHFLAAPLSFISHPLFIINILTVTLLWVALELLFSRFQFGKNCFWYSQIEIFL